MANEIILQGISKDELVECVSTKILETMGWMVERYNPSNGKPVNLLDKKQAAEYLNISIRKLDDLTLRGDIKYSKIDTSVRFKLSELDAYIVRREVRMRKFK